MESITDEYDTDVKMLKAELMLNEGQLENARNVLDTIEDADELETIINIVYLYMDMDTPKPPKNGWTRVLPVMAKKKISWRLWRTTSQVPTKARSRINFLQSTD